MIIILGLILVLVFMQLNQASSVKCFSFSCKHNRKGRCGRGKVTIYNNTVIGLCLYHTENMTERILEPMKEIKRGNGILQIKAQEGTEDEELLKNPNAFARWMRRQGIGK